MCGQDIRRGRVMSSARNHKIRRAGGSNVASETFEVTLGQPGAVLVYARIRMQRPDSRARVSLIREDGRVVETVDLSTEGSESVLDIYTFNAPASGTFTVQLSAPDAGTVSGRMLAIYPLSSRAVEELRVQRKAPTASPPDVTDPVFVPTPRQLVPLASQAIGEEVCDVSPNGAIVAIYTRGRATTRTDVVTGVVAASNREQCVIGM